MTITTICLVRHGETDWNALGKLQGSTDIPLNETGVQQAVECSKYFDERHLDIIITSPLKRAKQTAEIITQNRNTPLIEMREFVERHFGSAEGLTVQERQIAYPDKSYPNQEERLPLTIA